MFSKFIHVVIYVLPSHAIICHNYFNLFFHSSVGGQMDCFHFGATLNNAAMNIHIQLFV